MGAGAYEKLVDLLIKIKTRYPGIFEGVKKYGEEQAGPYGPAIREEEGKHFKFPELKPRGEGAEYPFFPPGIFAPYPKAFDDQGDWSHNDGTGNYGGSESDRIDELVDRVLGASQEDGKGREKRPFYYG